ncbi:hypothetical protein SDC9_96102 [bioreactor metagenome]|uniref:Uncharacterized protein n=1 Tax=bioreactor metagenome TaxID=1076179 RepID=A0A645AEV4_9ZZZZ
MGDEADVGAGVLECGGDRVDQEGHVVDDDLDDGVAGPPAVGLDGRGEHPQPDLAGGPLLGQLPVGQRRAEEVLGSQGGECLRAQVAPEGAQQGQHLVLVHPGGALGAGGEKSIALRVRHSHRPHRPPCRGRRSGDLGRPGTLDARKSTRPGPAGTGESPRRRRTPGGRRGRRRRGGRRARPR